MDAKSAVHFHPRDQVIDFDSFLLRSEFERWHDHFDQAIQRRADPQRHGDLPSWLALLDQLPRVDTALQDYRQDAITIGCAAELSNAEQEQLYAALYGLRPWRKGPYRLFDIHIDSEWRSQLKWQRLQPHISSLHGRTVLDVGCGNGYHCWRMLGEGASSVLGIDPSMRFQVQFRAVQYYAQCSRVELLPLGIEDMPGDMQHFDSVFSMGVLYHRRTPKNHMQELYGLLRPGGELILETLIVDEAEAGILRPTGRYAQMRNVWSIMTVDKLLEQLAASGFVDGVCVDQCITSFDEQRVTDWMQFQSLRDFLDPHDPGKTIEGYPAPKRAIIIAQKPA